MPSALVVVLSILGAILLIGLVARPRLLLVPVVGFFAAWAWTKQILALPTRLNDWLAASTLEKNAAGLAHHAAVAAHLWGAKSQFRPAAREIFARVTSEYGLQSGDDDIEDDSPLPLQAFGPQDPYDAAKVAAAAEAVQRGVPIGGKVAKS